MTEARVSMSSKYALSGVDIEAGDSLSAFAGKLSRSTYESSPFVDVYDFSRGNYRGPRGFTVKDVPQGCVLTMAPDGVGTKSVIIDAAGNYLDAASNLIAMTAMDITRYGGVPLVFTNVFDVKSIGEPGTDRFRACQAILQGLATVCIDNGYVLLNGETAELGPCVSSENPDALVHFNWAGVMFGLYHPERIILGDTLKPGQIIMALRDDFRSNGLSLVRKALDVKYSKKTENVYIGDGAGNEYKWFNNQEALKDVKLCASPAKQYDKPLTALHGWTVPLRGSTANVPILLNKPQIDMHLIVHLSGGAIKSKFAEDLLKPQGLSATLDTLFDPPEIMKHCAEWMKVTPDECYTSWNGGQGALVVIDAQEEMNFIEFMGRWDIEAKKAGVITEQQEYTVALKPKFGYGLKESEMVYY